MEEDFGKLPVTEVVTRRIQEMIRSGEFPPDAKLPSQRILSERLGVSRASLREALLTLETLGLIRTLPARGTFVTAGGITQPTPAPRYSQSPTIAPRMYDTTLDTDTVLENIGYDAPRIAALRDAGAVR